MTPFIFPTRTLRRTRFICIGDVATESAGKEIFLNITTVWSILNPWRGLESVWPSCLSWDGTGKISNKQVTMVSFRINAVALMP
jgi:hypothetical protein